jgi:hypothetical protein
VARHESSTPPAKPVTGYGNALRNESHTVFFQWPCNNLRPAITLCLDMAQKEQLLCVGFI